MKAFLFARVSTEEQKDAGNSLPAQIERMHNYCDRKGFIVAEEYSFDESAYKEKRDEFDELLAKLSQYDEKIAVCFDKVDRLSRNVFDKRVKELYDQALEEKIELHFVSDGQVINNDMSAVEKFQFGISLGLAKYYSDAISDNTKRGLEGMRERGEWSGPAPFGYTSVMRDVKKRLRDNLVPDPLNAHHVQEIFEMYASGQHSISTIRDHLNEQGVKTRTGRPFHNSAVHVILTNSFYYGRAYSRTYNKYFNHIYEPLISKSLFDEVETMLKERDNTAGHVKRKKSNPFARLLTCGNCVCTVCREVKRDKPYHACSNGKKICKREYIQEEKLMEQLKPLFQNIQLSDEQINNIVNDLRENHEYKARYHKEELKKLNAAELAIQQKTDSLLDLLLSDRITQEVYERKMNDMDVEKANINLKRAEHAGADKEYHIHAKHVCLLARRAGELFEGANDEEKNQILNLVLSNIELKDRQLTYTLKKPFDCIISYAQATQKATQCDPSVSDRKSVLRQLESFRTVNWQNIVDSLRYSLPSFLSLPSPSN